MQVSDQPDREAKTEEPSARRFEEAQEKGNTPFSREPAHIGMLLAFGLSLPLCMSLLLSVIAPQLTFFIDNPGEIRLETPQDAVALLQVVALRIANFILPVALGLGFVGILAGIMQNQPRLAIGRIAPDFSRISPSKGWSRIFGAAGRVEFLKSLFKTALVGTLLYWTLRDAPGRIVVLALGDASEIGRAIVEEISRLFINMGLLLLVLAVADLLWTRLKWRVDLRMTRQEVKDEHKQSEGDPALRARRLSLARSRARRRMIASVPHATLVVANPTHYAVALRYVHGVTPAPVVVAKGVDHLALRIRELAEARDIPVVEDRELARTLYAAVQTDRPIPPEFYRAVAAVIMHLMSRPPGPWSA